MLASILFSNELETRHYLSTLRHFDFTLGISFNFTSNFSPSTLFSPLEVVEKWRVLKKALKHAIPLHPNAILIEKHLHTAFRVNLLTFLFTLNDIIFFLFSSASDSFKLNLQQVFEKLQLFAIGFSLLIIFMKQKFLHLIEILWDLREL